MSTGRFWSLFFHYFEVAKFTYFARVLNFWQPACRIGFVGGNI
jgi:hypothetical protein